MKLFLLGLILGLLALPVAAYVYFRTGHAPVAVADSPFPWERQIIHAPLHARIQSEMPQTAPIEATAMNLQSGARIYGQQCAACHGFYGRPSSFGKYMYPHAPQLWERHHHNRAVGVSDDPVGETWWKIDNGIRLTGMPAFDKILDRTQIWQVALLLSRANQPLPAGVLNLLKQPSDVSGAALAPLAKPGATPLKAMPAKRQATSASASKIGEESGN